MERPRARRGRSAPPGAGGRGGAPAPPARRQAAASSSRAASSRTSPWSQLRCQTAKSAYWIGSSASGDGRPCEKASWSAESSRSSTPMDQPSETMWCRVRSRTCSSRPAAPGPGAAAARLEVERAPASARARARACASRCVLRQVRTDRGPAAATGSGAAITCTGSASPDAKVVRSVSCRRTISLKVRSSSPGSSRAGQAQSQGDVVGRVARLELVEEPEPLLREGERQGAPPPWRRPAGSPGRRGTGPAAHSRSGRPSPRSARRGSPPALSRQRSADSGLDAAVLVELHVAQHARPSAWMPSVMRAPLAPGRGPPWRDGSRSRARRRAAAARPRGRAPGPRSGPGAGAPPVRRRGSSAMFWWLTSQISSASSRRANGCGWRKKIWSSFASSKERIMP